MALYFTKPFTSKVSHGFGFSWIVYISFLYLVCLIYLVILSTIAQCWLYILLVLTHFRNYKFRLLLTYKFKKSTHDVFKNWKMLYEKERNHWKYLVRCLVTQSHHIHYPFLHSPLFSFSCQHFYFRHILIKFSFSSQTWETQFRTFHITGFEFLSLQSVTYNYLPIQKVLTNIKFKVVYIIPDCHSGRLVFCIYISLIFVDRAKLGFNL